MSDRANDALKQACRSHKNSRSHFNKFLHTVRIISQLAITLVVARVGARAKRPSYGGSPNSAFEAGNPLLQYVVAYFSEDAPNGSTVA